MVDADYRIRDFTPEDYVHEIRVRAALDPAVKFSVEEIRHFDSLLSQSPFVVRKLIASTKPGDDPIGIAVLNSDIESSDRRTFWSDVSVEPPHQGRGVGRLLASALETEARRAGARRLFASARVEDSRAIRFLARQGFSEIRRTWRSRLALAEATRLPDRTAVLAQEGIRFSSLAEEDPNDPKLLQELYALSTTAGADEPRYAPYSAPPFDQFVELEIRRPAVIPEAYLIARHSGRIIGVSSLIRLEAQPDAVFQSFTGILREYRGRGIATELKRRIVEHARTAGYRTMFVGNDSLNEPILGINRKLGFRPERERIIGERLLESGA